MARARITETVQDRYGNAHAGVLVTITNRANGAPATVYADDTSTAVIGNPVTSDIDGELSGWLDEGSYLLTAPGADPVPFEAVNGAGAAARAVAAQTIVTGNLAAGAQEVGSIPVGKSFRIARVTVNKLARVRLYSTAALRDAAGEAARTGATQPADGAGVILDAAPGAANAPMVLSPQALGSNWDTPRSTAIYYRVDNADVSAGAVTVTLDLAVIE